MLQVITTRQLRAQLVRAVLIGMAVGFACALPGYAFLAHLVRVETQALREMCASTPAEDGR